MKSLFKEYMEHLLRDESVLIRFAFILFVPMFFAILGFILEKSRFAAIGFLFAPLAVITIILVNGSYYLQDIYEIDEFSKTFTYLVGALFGINRATLKVAGGRKVLEDNEINTLDRIGGPGTINVEPGNAVILETLLEPSRILGAGEHTVSRNEIVKAVVSLEECDRQIPKMTVSTQDGIDVEITDIKFRFRIDQTKKEGTSRSLLNPYPFSVRAVYSQAYGRSIGADGKLGDWTGAVEGIVKGIISAHVAAHDLDTLMSPGIIAEHPLERLRQIFYENRNKFKEAGASLLWVNIGNFSVASADIDDQRFNVWSARQSGSAKVVRAQGESENISSKERGRAEGQVILLKSIAQALSDINIGDKNDEAATSKNLWNIVLARTAQILESMTSIYSFKNEKEGQDGH